MKWGYQKSWLLLLKWYSRVLNYFLAKLGLVHIIWFPLNIINYCPVRIVEFIPFVWTAGITNANSQWYFWSALFKIGFVQVERWLKLLQTFLKGIRFCLFCIYVVYLVSVFLFLKFCKLSHSSVYFWSVIKSRSILSNILIKSQYCPWLLCIWNGLQETRTCFIKCVHNINRTMFIFIVYSFN